ncbi:MAG: repeat-containing protein [Verrucomicrobiaceae bacterium]|nr:repeat-containing protein [Verrucomicrobiaceae bacterium]
MKPSLLSPVLRHGMFIGSLLAATLTAAALEPAVLKLHSADVNQKASTFFGSGYALTDKWIVLGEPFSDENGANTGNVQVFDRATGKFVRKLMPLVPASGAYFGNSITVSGNWALVSAYGSSVAANQAGAAYLFDLTTGKQLRVLTAPDAAPQAYLSAAAISGNLALIGASGHGDAVLGANSGAVYVFDLTTGLALREITASTGAANDYLGSTVSVSGRLGLVGAQGHNGSAGTAYLYDLVTGQELHQFTASDAAAGQSFGANCQLSGTHAVIGTGTTGKIYMYDTITGAETWKMAGPLNSGFGYCLAMSGNTLYVGALYEAFGTASNAGSVSVYDLNTHAQVGKLFAPDHSSGLYMGGRLAASGNTLLAPVTNAADSGLFTGAAYVFQNLAGPLPTATVAKTGDFAANVADAAYTAFTSASINDQGEVAFAATLAGTGAPAGKNIGAWSTLKAGAGASLLLRGGDTAALNVTAATVGVPLLNSNTFGLVPATLKGAGITAANDAVLYQDNTVTLIPLLREGTTVPGGTGLLATWPKVLQARAPSQTPMTIAAYTLKTGTAGITASNDSGIVIQQNGNAPSFVSNLAENTDAPSAGAKFGQFTGRLATAQSNVIFTVALQSVALTNQAVYSRHPASAPDLVARKNDPAPQTTGAKFASFVGETAHPSNSIDPVLFRATLAGGDATVLKNEGLWSSRSVNGGANTLALVLRKGDPVTGLPGVTFSAITGFWGVANNTVLIQATIKGPGITAANDTGLWLAQEDGTLIPLLREGDTAPDSLEAAKIGTLQKVEVDTYGGHYAVLASLVGGTVGKDQLLLTGSVLAGNATTQKVLRLPMARLRKGIQFQQALGTTAGLLSMSLATPSTEASGAGGTGTARAINALGRVVMSLTFSDKSVQMVTLDP